MAAKPTTGGGPSWSSAQSQLRRSRKYYNYFAAPIVRPPMGKSSAAITSNFVRWYGDQFYHTEARRLILEKS